MRQADYYRIHADYRGTYEGMNTVLINCVKRGTCLAAVEFTDPPAPFPIRPAKRARR